MIVGREMKFSAAHYLPNVPQGHKCARMHGHSYRVLVEVCGPVVEPTAWVIDFGMIDALLRTLVHDVCDHRLLNEIKGLENPTSEALCAWIARRIEVGLITEAITLHSVTVYEGDGGGWARLEFA